MTTKFKKLQQAAQQYFEDRAFNEVDQSDAERVVFRVTEKDRLEINFLQSLLKFEKGQLLNYSANHLKSLDIKLNKQYRKVLQTNANEIKATEKAWLLYRDAWVTFAAIHYPQVSAGSWKAWLAEERITALNNIPVQVSL